MILRACACSLSHKGWLTAVERLIGTTLLEGLHQYLGVLEPLSLASETASARTAQSGSCPEAGYWVQQQVTMHWVGELVLDRSGAHHLRDGYLQTWSGYGRGSLLMRASRG